MNKEIICTDLIIQENIKDEFILFDYEIDGEHIISNNIKPKDKFIMQKQQFKLKKNNLSLIKNQVINKGIKKCNNKNYRFPQYENIIKEYKGVISKIYQLIELKTIPVKFIPKKIIIEKYNIFYVNYYSYAKGFFSYKQKFFYNEKERKRFITLKKQSIKGNKNYDIDNYDISFFESEVKIYGFIFKESIISLMIQRHLDKDIINFFKELIEHDKGISFEEYINKQTNELINEDLELWLKGIKQ